MLYIETLRIVLVFFVNKTIREIEMNLKFLNLWPMLSLLCMQVSVAVPNNLFQHNNNKQTKTEIVVPNGQVSERQSSREENKQMIEACQLGYLGFIKLLVQKGVNINVYGDNGLTPLMEAARHGRFSIVKYLINEGADVNVRANNGSTAVQLAASSHHWEIVDFLKTYMLHKEEMIPYSGIRLPVSD